MMEPSPTLLWFTVVTLGTVGGPYLLMMAWHWHKKRRATRRRHLRLRQMADLEDRCESVSVGGLAEKLGMLRSAAEEIE